jgi:ribosomal protein L19E
MTNKNILNLIKQSAAKRILFLPHAVRQMSKPDRMISTEDIRHVIENGEVIDAYPAGIRGQRCRILGSLTDRPIHVVCSPKGEYLAIITAYLPSKEYWNNYFKTRRNS